MVEVPLSNSFLEGRDAWRQFSEFLGAGFSEFLGAGFSEFLGARQRISLGSENDWNFTLRSCQS